MLSPTLQFDVTSQQQQLLHAYQAQATSLKVTSEEFDGWLERIDQLSGVEVDELTALHGQLIASGMLKFEISGRSIGLKYQLSQQGKKALEVEAIDQDDEELAERTESDLLIDDESTDKELTAEESTIEEQLSEQDHKNAQLTTSDSVEAIQEDINVTSETDLLIAEAA